MRIVFISLVAAVIGLIAATLIYPGIENRVNPIGTLVLVLATVIYAWLTYTLVRQSAGSVQAMHDANSLSRDMLKEMRETRQQAASPIVRIGDLGGNLDYYKVEATNVGNSPAVNVEVALRTREGGAAVVLWHGGLLSPGYKKEIEFSLRPHAAESSVERYEFVSTYSNVIGERLETLTVFGRTIDGFLSGALTHRYRRS